MAEATEGKELDSLDSEGRKIVRELPEVKKRQYYLKVFETSPELAEKRSKMRSDMIDSLKCLAPLKERAKAQSFLERFANAVSSSSTGTQSYESLGEALPKYIEGVEASIHDIIAAKGIDATPVEAQHILLDWILQPFYSNLFMIGDDRRKDDALLELYSTYNYMEEQSMQPWVKLSQEDLTFFCLRFDELNRLTSILDKAQALLNIVSFLSKTAAKTSPDPDEVSTDFLLEGLTFIVMRLKPHQICANIAFLLRFSPDSVIKGELGYCITTFSVVLQGLLQKSIKEEEASLENDWVIFRRGKRRITEAEGRRLLAEFMEDCVVMGESADYDDAEVAAALAAAKETKPRGFYSMLSPKKSSSAAPAPAAPAKKDEIDKEWVLM